MSCARWNVCTSCRRGCTVSGRLTKNNKMRKPQLQDTREVVFTEALARVQERSSTLPLLGIPYLARPSLPLQRSHAVKIAFIHNSATYVQSHFPPTPSEPVSPQLVSFKQPHIAVVSLFPVYDWETRRLPISTDWMYYRQRTSAPTRCVKG